MANIELRDLTVHGQIKWRYTTARRTDQPWQERLESPAPVDDNKTEVLVCGPGPPRPRSGVARSVRPYDRIPNWPSAGEPLRSGGYQHSTISDPEVYHRPALPPQAPAPISTQAMNSPTMTHPQLTRYPVTAQSLYHEQNVHPEEKPYYGIAGQAGAHRYTPGQQQPSYYGDGPAPAPQPAGPPRWQYTDGRQHRVGPVWVPSRDIPILPHAGLDGGAVPRWQADHANALLEERRELPSTASLGFSPAGVIPARRQGP